MFGLHKHWHYPNITLLLISVAVTAWLFYNGHLETVTVSFGTLGYIGVFLAGMMFVSTFTILPATAILFAFAQDLPALPVALTGAAGAMIMDYLAFRFIRDRLLAELNPFLKMLRIYRPVNILKTKYFAWLAPVVGAIVVASPLPDELGLTLLGLTKISAGRFIALTFVLNFIGILLIALAAQ
ncbi:MAG: hypothetical protein WD970_01125 [Patescibacteria group bacterium]